MKKIKSSIPKKKKITSKQYSKIIFTPLLAIFVLQEFPYTAHASKHKRTPEEESLYFLKHAKPIPNDKWESIAGPRVSEKYEIIKGDTLSDISKRLFGDPRYWPKIWAINNGNITNPHKISPGVNIAFSPGSGSSLPSVSIKSSNTTLDTKESAKSVSDIPHSQGRSTEWQFLPKQSWESFRIEMPPEIDPLGFDKNSKVIFHQTTGFETQIIPATEKIPFLGQIVGSRSEGTYLGMGDTVYIRADAPLQVGDIYAITQEPTLIKSSRSDRVGYSYLNLGKVKIVGVRDKLFIGTILSARNFVARGASLVKLPEKIPVLTPIPGPRPIHGVVMVDHNLSTYAIAQYKEVFIDRGSDDGIKPGMVFRAYEHYDPGNEKKITNTDFIIDADIQITQVTETLSTGMVIQFKSMIKEDAKVVLLTDVSDLIKNPGFREKGDNAPESDLNDLDNLDDQDSLGKEERKELRQLEKWQKNPEHLEQSPNAPDTTPPPPVETSPGDSTTPPTSDLPPPSSDTPPPPPTDSELPPPAAEPPPPSTEAPPPPNAEAPSPPADTPPPPANEPPDPALPEPPPPNLEAPPS